MKRRSALGTALFLALAASAPAVAGDPAEARAVVLATLDRELGSRAGRIAPVCVSIEPDRAPLDGIRQAWSRPPGKTGPRFGMAEQWRGHGEGRSRPLAEPARARLRTALDAAIARPSGPALTLADDLRWFPFTPLWPGCSTFVLSAPEFAGDFAFIEVDYRCFGLCSQTWLVALERRDGRWIPVATITTRIS